MTNKAIVAKVTEVIEIPGAEKIHVAIVLGERVIVSKDVGVGYVGIYFPVGVQLSADFCKHNNLFRHSQYNADPDKKGFFEDSRRVRAQPFLGVQSCGYFTSLSSLDYILAPNHPGTCPEPEFQLGEEFDVWYGQEICKKYISQATIEAMSKQNKPKQAKINYAPYFDKHVESQQFKHSAQMIPEGALLHFHVKVHGTSHRSGYTKVTTPLNWFKRTVNSILKRDIFATWKWDYVVGTRNVVLLDKGKEGFHGSEQFRFDVAESLKPFLEKGMIVYGEIAGYANGKPIMAVHSSKATKDKAFIKKFGEDVVYKYGCAEHEYRFHIYRITRLTEAGDSVDMSQAQLEQWCKDKGFLPPLDVHVPIIYNGNVRDLQDLVEKLTERVEAGGADWIDPMHPTEGIIIRVDTGQNTPTFLKSKNYYFKVMEGMVEAVDIEDAA